MSPSSEHRIEWANALRGFAAVSVLVYHFGQVFWTRPEEAAGRLRHEPLYVDPAQAPGFAQFLEGLPIDLGGFGIALFFVLSGYVIALSTERYSRPGFFMGRFLRVLPTYAVGFLLSVAVVVALLQTAGGTGPGVGWAGTLAGVVPGLPILLGTDAVRLGVEWTLIIELAFYGACLLTYRWIARTWVAPLVLGAACVGVQVGLTTDWVARHAPSSLDGAVYLAQLVAPFLPLLLVGVVVSSVQRGRSSAWALLLVPALLGATGFLMSTSSAVPTTGEYQGSVLGAAAVFLVLCRTAGRFRSGRLLRALAAISYPLYVTHVVSGYAVLLVLVGAGWQPVPALAVAVVGAVALAVLLHRLVEEPTRRYGQLCARRAGRRPARPAPRPRVVVATAPEVQAA